MPTKGDDPLTEGVDDVQLIDCKITVKGKTTASIPYNAPAAMIKHRLKVSFWPLIA
jgi:hypothetical protein